MSEHGSTPYRPTFAMPTLGGKQLWGDERLHAGFRIQRNAVTGHYRLLDPNDIRVAWGSWEHCCELHDRLVAARHVAVQSDHLVLLLHGFFRSKDSLIPLTRGLRAAGFEAHAVNYPSTQQSLADHADQLERILDHTDDAARVSFVAHSMGGMVARVLLSRDGGWRRRIKPERLVMIATPNKGAVLAERLMALPGLGPLAGPALSELRRDWAMHIPEPTIEFGIIAGARGDGRGFNPLLPGDDDMTVSLDSVLLEGAADTLVLPAVHSLITAKPAVVQATIRFLRTGRFSAS